MDFWFGKVCKTCIALSPVYTNSISDVQNILFHVASLRCTTFRRNGYHNDIYHYFFPKKVRLNEFLNVLNPWTKKTKTKESKTLLTTRCPVILKKKGDYIKLILRKLTQNFFHLLCNISLAPVWRMIINHIQISTD